MELDKTTIEDTTMEGDLKRMKMTGWVMKNLMMLDEFQSELKNEAWIRHSLQPLTSTLYP